MLRFFFLCCLCSNAYAGQLFHLAPEKKINAIISDKELNRIAVQDDRIVQVFGVSGHFVVESDEKNGQIFIKSVGGHHTENLALTIITEKGATQDIYLQPKSVSSQAVVLVHPKENQKKAQKWEQQTPFQQSLIKLMVSMARGQSISGFRFEVNKQERPVFSDISIKQLHILTGSKLQGIVFEIKNMDNIPKLLSEKRFSFFANVAAIALEKTSLNPGQSTRLYVIKHV